MIINDIEFSVDLIDIITELQNQLSANNITLLQKIKDSNTDIMVSCPFHADGQERRPSAGIRKDDGLLHCFACGETRSLNEVISYCFGYEDFGKFGWNWLLKNFTTISKEDRKDVKIDISRKGIALHNADNKHSITDRDNQSVNYIGESELDKYRYYHPYMYKRKLTDDIIELFDIGYDKNTDCITFPVRDINGNCLFVARRSVKTKYFNYPQNAEKPLYGLYELYKTCKDLEKIELVICESMLDALTVWVYGGFAIALNGLGSTGQLSQFNKLPCRKLILATDNDSAGRQARQRIKLAVRNKILTEYILPENRKDINELSKSEFENLLEVFI